MRRLALALLFLVACSSETDSGADLPYADAERARGLPFLRKPALVTRTRASYAQEVAAEVTDEDVVRYKTVWGRLGFVPTDFDLRAASQASAARVGAFYEPDDGGRITKFDEHDEPAYMVHELVHALQDQHFSLTALDASARTTDELLALRALAEGDARVAEMRYVTSQRNVDPFISARVYFSPARAELDAEEALAFDAVPAFLSAYASFCYTFGAAVVAQEIGAFDEPPHWSTGGSDALFRGGAPRSSEAVLRTVAGKEIDPIVEVGMVDLPEPLREKYEIREIDRLGAWYAWILRREAREVKSEIALDWDGDQLVVIGPRDATQPPSAIVWTSAWETDFDAEAVVADLRRLHGGAAESLVIEQNGVEVVIAKGTLPQAEIQMLANAALYDRSSGPRPAARRKKADVERFFSLHSTGARRRR